MLQKLCRQKQGFSLIELILVIVIIGILAAAGLSSSGTYVDESKVTKMKAEVSTLEIAVSQYNVDHPSQTIGSGQLDDANLQKLITGGYLQKKPDYWSGNTNGCKYNYAKKDQWTTPHVYVNGCSFQGSREISVY